MGLSEVPSVARFEDYLDLRMNHPNFGDAGSLINTVREQAFELCQQGSYRDAFVNYKRLLLEYDQQSAAVLSEAGLVCWKLKLMDEAEQCFAKALEMEPFHREALINRVEMHLEQRQTKGVEEDLTHLLEHYPNDVEVTAARIQWMFVKGETKNALMQTRTFVARSHAPATARFLSAKVLIEQRQFRAAIELLETKSVVEDPPILEVLRARVYGELGDLGKSESIYRTVLNGHPEQTDALIELAKLLAVKGDMCEARGFAEMAATLAPGTDEANVTYFSILVAAQEWETLYIATERQLERVAPMPDALVFHATALIKLGRYEELERFLRRYEAHTPKTAEFMSQ